MDLESASAQSTFNTIYNPRRNKGLAFTRDERAQLGIEGLLPDSVDDPATQLARCASHLSHKPTNLERYIYLSELEDRNERLFYRLLRSDLGRFMPLVYTPTVGEACQEYGHILRRPKGMWLSLRMKGRLREVLRNWPDADTRFIVVTDGERILGLGDLGANGMGIPVGKLALYTAVAGVPPWTTLPVHLDVGTNNESLLANPLYPGLRQHRATGDEYLAFVEEFVDAVQHVFPQCCIQFEDFAGKIAVALLDCYRDRCCCFNDDVQGTAGVALAGLLGACRVLGQPLKSQRVLFLGAGAAATGIANLIALEMESEGLEIEQARARCSLMNSRGLVTSQMSGLSDFQMPFAHAAAPCSTLIEAVRQLKPTALIGVSTQGGAFTEEVIREMSSLNSRPIIFPYSNPTSKSECTAQQAMEWTGGRAIFGSGSPFPPVTVGNRTITLGQGNNVYIFPAVGMAVYATQASRVPESVFLEAARTLASQVTEASLRDGIIYPPVGSIMACSEVVAIAVAKHIVQLGLARNPEATRPGADIADLVRRLWYHPETA
ncbi:MAG: NAD-dependent malic enzyme [Planctomycetota bacterium]|nr:NAD-dependent malic enzyme [Planctomycetota bacterium]MDA1106270.1 NAD-dependent malic enzyme [Planctomycetota bacterium]